MRTRQRMRPAFAPAPLSRRLVPRDSLSACADCAKPTARRRRPASGCPPFGRGQDRPPTGAAGPRMPREIASRRRWRLRAGHRSLPTPAVAAELRGRAWTSRRPAIASCSAGRHSALAEGRLREKPSLRANRGTSNSIRSKS